ncbi:hypothetical protein ACHAW6_001496 [Cyclotella cf. meneghiniana]
MLRHTRKQHILKISRINSHESSNQENSYLNHDDNSRRKSKLFIPKWILGFFMIFLVAALVNELSRVAENSPTDTRNISSDAVSYLSSSSFGLRIKLPGNKSISTHQRSQDSQLNSPTTNATLHVIFSTDCSSYQHWQSYLFFYSALKVKQPGYVTRIASGCDEQKLKEEREWHETHIQNVMSDRFRIHFTPGYSGVKDELTGKVTGDYSFFNKPFGLKHFLEHSEFMGLSDVGEMKNPDVIVILCDPDFLLLRSITDDFSNQRETLISPQRKMILDKRSPRGVVEHGNPFAQTWMGLGTKWMTFNIDEIAGKYSPAKSVDQSNALLFYQVGPPYIGTATDMHKIAEKWSEYAPRVHKEYPQIHAEMYAYCIAAAHLELPHTLVDSLMISSARHRGEGWKFIQDIPSDKICHFAAHPDRFQFSLPSVIHYCYCQYAVDKFFYSKRKVPHDIFTCDSPLLLEPPEDIGSGKYLSLVEEGSKNHQRQKISADVEKENGFILCAMTMATNEAMHFFKENHCEGGGNREKTYDLWAAQWP